MDFYTIDDEFTTKEELREEVKRLRSIIARNKQRYLDLQEKCRVLHNQVNQAHDLIKKMRSSSPDNLEQLFKDLFKR